MQPSVLFSAMVVYGIHLANGEKDLYSGYRIHSLLFPSLVQDRAELSWACPSALSVFLPASGLMTQLALPQLSLSHSVLGYCGRCNRISTRYC